MPDFRIRPRCAALLLPLVFACAPSAHAETVASVESPDHVLRVELDITEGRLGYRVLRFGQPVIATSRLGFQLRGQDKLERNMTLAAQATRGNDDTW